MFKGLLLLLFLLSLTLATNNTFTKGPFINIVGPSTTQYVGSVFSNTIGYCPDETLPEGGYVLIVSEKKVCPGYVTLLYCQTPGCNDVHYITNSIYYFKSKKEALQKLNSMDKTTCFKLFRLQEQLVKQVKIGKETIRVPIYVDKSINVYNWQ